MKKWSLFEKLDFQRVLRNGKSALHNACKKWKQIAHSEWQAGKQDLAGVICDIKSTDPKAILLRAKYEDIGICSFLLACIVCAHCVRYLFNITESSLLIYGIYFLFIALGGYYHHKQIRFPNDRKMRLLAILSGCMILYAFITSPFLSMSAFVDSVKLLVGFGTAYIIFLMPSKDLKKTLDYAIGLCTFYAVIIWVFPGHVDAYLARGSNYLNLTLPVGLVFSVLLCRLLSAINFKREVRVIAGYLLLCILYFIVLTRFTARASILFPAACAVVILVIQRANQPKQLARGLGVLAVIVTVAGIIFLNTASDYVVNRMLRLFKNILVESRWGLWGTYINHVVQNKWYLLGGGAGASEVVLSFYPHNIYMQLVGEFGLLGIAVSIYVTYLLVEAAFITCRLGWKNTVETANLSLGYDMIAGFLYMFLTFMKSYTLFDGSVLFVFIAALLHLARIMQKTNT